MNDVEAFARTELFCILQANENVSEEILKSYFGDFAPSTNDFVLSGEEKELISKCAKHVKYIVDFDGINENLAHFGFGDKIEPSLQPECESSELNSPMPNTRTHIFLERLTRIANQNATRKKEGYRFDKEIKEFATYLRMVCGPFAYETLQKNLDLCLPSLSATNRYMRKKAPTWSKEFYELRSWHNT